MADQKRWFKTWTSLLIDMDALPDDLIGKWTRLGCRIALVGTKGRVVFASMDHLAGFFGVPVDAAPGTLAALPNVVLSDAPIWWPNGPDRPPVCQGTATKGERFLTHACTEVGTQACIDPTTHWGTRHGELFVTMKNWKKYQEDTTQAQRAATSRAKKRREERRRDEKSSSSSRVTAKPPKDRIRFDETTGRLAGIAPVDMAAWGRAYPGVDFQAVIADAENYLRDHAGKYRDLSAFLRGQFRRAKRSVASAVTLGLAKLDTRSPGASRPTVHVGDVLAGLVRPS